MARAELDQNRESNHSPTKFSCNHQFPAKGKAVCARRLHTRPWNWYLFEPSATATLTVPVARQKTKTWCYISSFFHSVLSLCSQGFAAVFPFLSFLSSVCWYELWCWVGIDFSAKILCFIECCFDRREFTGTRVLRTGGKETKWGWPCWAEGVTVAESKIEAGFCQLSFLSRLFSFLLRFCREQSRTPYKDSGHTLKWDKQSHIRGRENLGIARHGERTSITWSDHVFRPCTLFFYLGFASFFVYLLFSADFVSSSFPVHPRSAAATDLDLVWRITSPLPFFLLAMW